MGLEYQSFDFLQNPTRQYTIHEGQNTDIELKSQPLSGNITQQELT